MAKAKSTRKVRVEKVTKTKACSFCKDKKADIVSCPIAARSGRVA